MRYIIPFLYSLPGLQFNHILNEFLSRATRITAFVPLGPEPGLQLPDRSALARTVRSKRQLKHPAGFIEDSLLGPRGCPSGTEDASESRMPGPYFNELVGNFERLRQVYRIECFTG